MTETLDFSELVALTTELKHAGWRTIACQPYPDGQWRVSASQEAPDGRVRVITVGSVAEAREQIRQIAHLR